LERNDNYKIEEGNLYRQTPPSWIRLAAKADELCKETQEEE